MKKYGRTDANQQEIVALLREIPGITVVSLADIGGGVPDILLGYKGRNYIVELKDGNKPPSKRRLTEAQKKFHAEWRGQIDVAKTFDEILEVIK